MTERGETTAVGRPVETNETDEADESDEMDGRNEIDEMDETDESDETDETDGTDEHEVDTSHLDDIDDGCGCAEVWEHTSDAREE